MDGWWVGGWMVDGGWMEFVSEAQSCDGPFPQLAPAAEFILWPSSHASSLINSLSGFNWISWISRCQWREGWQGKESLACGPKARSAASLFSGCVL